MSRSDVGRGGSQPVGLPQLFWGLFLFAGGGGPLTETSASESTSCG